VESAPPPPPVQERGTLRLRSPAVRIGLSLGPKEKAGAIIKLVCAHFGLTLDALRSPARPGRLTGPRLITYYLINKHTPLSFPSIGRLLGGRDHSTVYVGVGRIRDQMTIDHELRQVVEYFCSLIETEIWSG